MWIQHVTFDDENAEFHSFQVDIQVSWIGHLCLQSGNTVLTFSLFYCRIQARRLPEVGNTTARTVTWWQLIRSALATLRYCKCTLPVPVFTNLSGNTFLKFHCVFLVVKPKIQALDSAQGTKRFDVSHKCVCWKRKKENGYGVGLRTSKVKWKTWQHHVSRRKRPSYFHWDSVVRRR
jgi:hypothetical protein